MPVVLLRRLVTALLLISLSTLSLSAQQKRNPEEQPRKVKQELKKAYVEWINDVDPILTQSERDAWTKLDTDDEREQFIKIVWDSRDPDPDTEENEFKERVAGLLRPLGHLERKVEVQRRRAEEIPAQRGDTRTTMTSPRLRVAVVRLSEC